MSDSSIDSINLDGVTKFPRGQQLLTEFVDKVAIARARSEVRAARQQRAVDGDGI